MTGLLVAGAERVSISIVGRVAALTDLVAPTIIVIAKSPIAGRVKTRLCPPLSPHQAADVAGHALADTLATVDAGRFRERLLYFEGDVAAWLPVGWTYREQCGGGLDIRIADAFGHVEGPAVLVGMDTPQVTPAQLSSFDASRFDTCLGPTIDGGYWAIGFRDPRHAAAAVPGVPMSSTRTCAEQLTRLTALGLSVHILDLLVDVDTMDSAHVVAASAPHTRFAAAISRITVRGG